MTTAKRIEALDALRGFALRGIIFINIPQTMSMTTHLAAVPEGLRLFVLGFTLAQVGNLLAKLGCRDRVQAVVLAYERGVVRPGLDRY